LESQQPEGQVAGPQPAPSGEASVTSSGASIVAGASAATSSTGPESATSEETAVESFAVVPSEELPLASPESSCGARARQPARVNDTASARTARSPER
jgi:hypothetical protein